MIRPIFAPNCIEILLRPRGRAIVFLLAVGVPALFLSFETVRIATAARLGESTKLPDVRRALSLDPGNPELYRQLAMFYAYSLDELNPVEAVKHLRRAAELNPYKTGYWSELASACESIGDTLCADQALERALRLSPMTPDLRWATANHYLRSDRPDTALRHFQHLLKMSPEHAWPTFQVCLRAVGNPQTILQRILPADSGPELKLAYVNFLSGQGENDLAYQVWGQAVSRASQFPFWLAEPYLQRLIDLGRDREAIGVWRDLMRLGIVHKPETLERDNAVFNGDFEQVPLNAGFDWRYQRVPFLACDFQDATAYRGSRCLRLDFTVSRNDEYEPVHQIVPVVPDRAYLLTGYCRSENITSDSGPRLRVTDPNCRDCLDVSSETTVGTTSWQAVGLRFLTGVRTHFVRLSVWRARSRTYPAEISGRFWLDAVSLRSSVPANTDPKPGL